MQSCLHFTLPEYDGYLLVITKKNWWIVSLIHSFYSKLWAKIDVRFYVVKVSFCTSNCSCSSIEHRSSNCSQLPAISCVFKYACKPLLSIVLLRSDALHLHNCLRFDSKRFCRDCRRNVIREFKELKELKRMRREPRCTSWFCVADTSFLYEVLHWYL